MCGIAGIWSRRHRDLNATVNAMSDAIMHRGPDSSGLYIDESAGLGLGHRRLAIVDLSEAGHQPMRSACGRYCIVYNGELYGHLALRAALERDSSGLSWRGHSDTETLLNAISIWGLEQTLERITGMFAFALWDQSQRCLHLARDRFGEKPLYYGIVDDAFVFASELSSIRQVPGWQGIVDEQAVGHFLRYSSVPAPLSIYKNIRKLPAAHWVTLSDPAHLPETRCYWQVDKLALMEKPSVAPEADEALIDRLQAMMKPMVAARMMSDVPLGAFLSGGVDSSLVVSLMQEASMQPVNTFCIGFDEASHDESRHAKAVAAHLGTHHVEHIVSGQEALAIVPDLCSIWDEPFADSSQIPTFLVSRLARQSVTVALSGDGGDELFGGYGRYVKTLAIGNKLNHIPGPVCSAAAHVIDAILPALSDGMAATGKWSQRWVGKLDRVVALSELIGTKNTDELYDALVSLRSGPESLMREMSIQEQRFIPGVDPEIELPQRLMQRDFKHYLPEVILTKVDRASMSVSLEARAPLLDPALAQFAASLPWSIKRHAGVAKWPLMTLLKRYVPAEIVERPKMGFGVPIHSWLRGPLKSWAEDLLSPSALRNSPFLNERAVRKLWEQHQSHRYDWRHPLWNVLMLQSWLAHHER